jgi:hypothetical protein
MLLYGTRAKTRWDYGCLTQHDQIRCTAVAPDAAAGVKRAGVGLTDGLAVPGFGGPQTALALAALCEAPLEKQILVPICRY